MSKIKITKSRFPQQNFIILTLEGESQKELEKNDKTKINVTHNY